MIYNPASGDFRRFLTARSSLGTYGMGLLETHGRQLLAGLRRGEECGRLALERHPEIRPHIREANHLITGAVLILGAEKFPPDPGADFGGGAALRV